MGFLRITQGGGGVTQVGAQWETLLSVDFSALSSASWSDGTQTIEGIDHTISGTSFTSTFGPNGSTGVRIVQSSAATAPNGPKIAVAVSDISSDIKEGGDILFDVLYTLNTVPGNNALFCAGQEGSSRTLACGPIYQTTPGRWEWRAFISNTQRTDYGTAIAASSGAAMTLHLTSKALRWYDRGASADYPDTPDPDDMTDAIGWPAGNPDTSLSPAMVSSDLIMATGRAIAGAVIDITIHGYRVRYRGLS